DVLRLVTQGEIDGSRHFLAYGRVRLDLFADDLARSKRWHKPIGEHFIFTKKPQQYMFRLDIRGSELAGFVTCEEDDPSRLLRVSFEHLLEYSDSAMGPHCDTPYGVTA